MNEASRTDPLLSVILVADKFKRVEAVLESFAGQTVANKIELVVVMTTAADTSVRAHIEKKFYSLKVIDVESIVHLAAARAKGVRAATAPIVFIAETHAFPDPDMAEKLIGALTPERSRVIPAFRNANPHSGISWAGFISDYGGWVQTLPAREIERAPSYNAVFRRSVLLEFGDRLDNVLTFGDELYLAFRTRGHVSYFESAAGIQHVNISRLGSFVRERYLAGVLIGGYRSARWGLMRRLAYAAGSPLIPIVMLFRMRDGVQEAWRTQSLPAGTIPALVLGAIIKGVGEVRGYLFRAPESAEEGMTGLEVRKLAFNAGEES